MLRPILPSSGPPVEDLERFLIEERGGAPDRWVMVNMVSSLDGATALQGGATALTDPDDQRLFAALRSISDAIVVGAATVRAEDYGPVKIDPEVVRWRNESRRPERPRLAVLTRNLDLDPESRLFSDPANPPLIYTGSTAPSDRRRVLEGKAEIVVGPGPLVDPSFVMEDLVGRGSRYLLCEGGPTINGQLLEADVVDELNIAMAPVAVGGNAARLAHSVSEIYPPLEFGLDRVLAGDRMLFFRYLRSRSVS